MTDWKEHYKAVRARLHANAYINKVKPPKLDEVMPEPPNEETQEEKKSASYFLRGCPLSARRQGLVLPVLEEFNVTWEQLWSKDRRAIMHTPRRKVWLKLWEDGMSMLQIGQYTRRDHTTVLWGLRAIKKEQSQEQVECITGTH